jgi:hypothetical protein
MRMRPDVHRQAPLDFMREAAALAPEIRTVMLEPGEALELAKRRPAKLSTAASPSSGTPADAGSQ